MPNATQLSVYITVGCIPFDVNVNATALNVTCSDSLPATGAATADINSTFIKGILWSEGFEDSSNGAIIGQRHIRPGHQRPVVLVLPEIKSVLQIIIQRYRVRKELAAPFYLKSEDNQISLASLTLKYPLIWRPGRHGKC
ncbi:MAG: hypothetical protein U5K79_23300 [Cyclobacteriaceae bacterium]|nr:hypothetical protein [Cyclobacteriaceae bacterium]